MNDDERHKREEEERRAKRKAHRISKSDAAKDKERKRKEHAQRVLQQQKKGSSSKPSPSPKKEAPDSSLFEGLFTSRSQGFQMEFQFRNAPPRPPVGPLFVGGGLDGQLQELSHYQPRHMLLAHTWRLHSEPDLGVPLAPSAMDLTCYKETTASEKTQVLHKDDEALLNWTGSLGDSASEDLKLRQDKARANARLALAGHKVPTSSETTVNSNTPRSLQKRKKEFSRVLDETMQSWMKKTTYLSNDYSRKVHDFTSLAQTKQSIAQELQAKQDLILKTGAAVAETFQQTTLKHPTQPHLKPLRVMPLLPNVDHWGQDYTHVVLDNPPKSIDANEEPTLESLDKAFVAHVEKRPDTARMNCQLLVPSSQETTQEGSDSYGVLQLYDLDVLPLKEEDGPHETFCLWLPPPKDDDDDDESPTLPATYLPIASRVQLSTGRPPQKQHGGSTISRRHRDPQETKELQERLAEVNADLVVPPPPQEETTAATTTTISEKTAAASSYTPMQVEDDSSEEEEETFGNASATIVAEG